MLIDSQKKNLSEDRKFEAESVAFSHANHLQMAKKGAIFGVVEGVRKNFDNRVFDYVS